MLLWHSTASQGFLYGCTGKAMHCSIAHFTGCSGRSPGSSWSKAYLGPPASSCALADSMQRRGCWAGSQAPPTTITTRMKDWSWMLQRNSCISCASCTSSALHAFIKPRSNTPPSVPYLSWSSASLRSRTGSTSGPSASISGARTMPIQLPSAPPVWTCR